MTLIDGRLYFAPGILMKDPPLDDPEGLFCAFEQRIDGLFLEPSWLAVYLGQRVMPHGYDLRADAPEAGAVTANLTRVREQVQSAVERMPNHEEFLRQYCPAAPMPMKSGAAP